MEQIEHFNFPKLRNAEHVQFHFNIRLQLPAAVVQELGIQPQYDAYNASFQEEENAFKKNKGYKETVEMVNADNNRDKTTSLISMVTKAYLKDTNEAKREAAKKVSNIIHQYKNIQGMPFFEESAVISKICIELKKAEMAPYLAELGITENVNALEKYNMECINLESSRHLSRIPNSKDFRKLRAEVDDAYKVMVTLINSLYVYNTSYAPDTAKAAAINSTIKEINSHISNIKKIVSLRTSRLENRKENEEESKEPTTDIE